MPRARSAATAVWTDELLTVRETAALLKLAPKTIYALLWGRKLAYVKIGRRVRIPQTQLEHFLQERVVASSFDAKVGDS